MSEKKVYEDLKPAQRIRREQLIKEFEAGNYTFDAPYLTVDPFGQSPLSALLMFRTDQETRIVLKTPGKDRESTFTQVFGEYSKVHYIPVYALYAGCDNEVRLTAIGRDGRKAYQTVHIKTAPLPADMQKIEIQEIKREKLADGLIFVNGNYALPMHLTDAGKAAGQKPSYTAAFDRNGDIRWYLSDIILGNVGPMTPLKNGNMMIGSEKAETGYYTQSCYEINLMGEFVHEYFCDGIHHDIIEMPDGKIVALTREPGSHREEDYIVEFDRETCEIVREWDAKKIFPIPESVFHYRSRKHPERPETLDWCHMNSIVYDASDDSFIFSARNQDALVKYDAATGEVKWILTEPADDPQKELIPEELRGKILKAQGDLFFYPHGQHKVTLLPNGDLLIFDNMVSYHKYRENLGIEVINKSSRAVLYRVDEDQMTVEKLWASDRDLGIEGNSAVMGNADYLGTGHYWIDFSATMFDNEGRQTQGYWDFLTAPVQNCLFVELLNDEVVFKARYNGNFCTCYRSHVYMPYWAGNEWK